MPADLVAGVGTSHVPAIGAAIDRGLTGDPYFKPLFDGYERARELVAETSPDVLVLIYNDHGAAFFLDIVPTFVIGTAAEFPIADEGYGPRPVPPVEGDPDLAWHLVESLVDDGFDMTVAQEMRVDHGLTVPLSILYGQPDRWPAKVVPLAVNVVQYPTPTALRCWQLGQAIRRALTAYEGSVRVAMVGTGGMSHQLQGQRAGFINSAFDQRFFDLLVSDPQALTKLDRATYIREAGSEGLELIMWLIMRGAMDPTVREVHRHYHVPVSNTAAGLIVLENA